jgi:hypothetical protein
LPVLLLDIIITLCSAARIECAFRPTGTGTGTRA